MCHVVAFMQLPRPTDVRLINEAAQKNVNLQAHLDHQGDGLKLLVDITPGVNLEQVQLFINSSNPLLKVHENIFFFANLKAHDKHSFETEIKLNESFGGDIYTNELSILVSFINKQSIARAFRHVMNIPKKFLLEKTVPQKDGMFKVTLTISSLRLSDLFKGNSTHTVDI